MIVKINGVSVLAVLMLTACGGSDGGSSSQSASSYSALVASERNAFADWVDDYDLIDDMTPTDQMPSTGTATYRGPGTLRVDQTDIYSSADAAGQARLRANFSTGTIAGQITEFRPSPEHSTASGSLRMTARISEDAMIGNMSGAVNIDGINHGIDEEAVGLFLGPNADSVIAWSDGTTSQGNDYRVVITGDRN